jgi:hypothetical protein
LYRYSANDDIITPPADSPSHLPSRVGLSRKSNIDELNNRDVFQEREHKLDVSRKSMKLSQDIDLKYKQACVSVVDTENHRLQALSASGSKAKINVGGSPFNIINMQYNRTPEGDRLRLHDDLAQYRRALRSYNLAVRNHVGLDPISGCQSFDVALPKFTHG